jgi:hypothetical protein
VDNPERKGRCGVGGEDNMQPDGGGNLVEQRPEFDGFGGGLGLGELERLAGVFFHNLHCFIIH